MANSSTQTSETTIRWKMRWSSLFATACSSGGGEIYPESVVENFMAECIPTSGGNTEYCECALDGLQEEMTLDEFIEFEQDVIRGGEAPSVVIGIMADCLRQYG